MSVWIKEGVCGDLSREMTKEHGRVVEYYKRKGYSFFVTSRREGNHKAGSFHYRGDAEDFKAQGITWGELSKYISPRFDLLFFKINGVGYFHLEYDPKVLT